MYPLEESHTVVLVPGKLSCDCVDSVNVNIELYRKKTPKLEAAVESTYLNINARRKI